jgi:hypothetical protein
MSQLKTKLQMAPRINEKVALIEFSDAIRRIIRVCGGHKPSAFIQTSIPIGTLQAVGKFLVHVAKVKQRARSRVLSQ